MKGAVSYGSGLSHPAFADKIVDRLYRIHDLSNPFVCMLEHALHACKIGPHDGQWTAGRTKGTNLPRLHSGCMEIAMDCLAHWQQVAIDPDKSCNGWYDLWGDVYERVAGKYKKSGLGQFFTPQSLCDAMSKMNIGHVDDTEVITVLDPTCGSGRTLLSAWYHIQQKIGRSVRKVKFYGNDLDRVCILMSTLNFYLHGLSGELTHGNGLWITENYRGGVRLGINYLGDIALAGFEDRINATKQPILEKMSELEKLDKEGGKVPRAEGLLHMMHAMEVSRQVDRLRSQRQQWFDIAVNSEFFYLDTCFGEEHPVLVQSNPGDNHLHYFGKLPLEQAKYAQYELEINRQWEAEQKMKEEEKRKAEEKRKSEMLFVEPEKPIEKAVKVVKRKKPKKNKDGNPPPQMSLF